MPVKDELEKAKILIKAISDALMVGTLHYRKSDGKQLDTLEEILQTLLDEGSVGFKQRQAAVQIHPIFSAENVVLALSIN